MNLHLIKEKDYDLTPYRGEELLRADLRSGKTGIRQSRPVFKKKKPRSRSIKKQKKEKENRKRRILIITKGKKKRENKTPKAMNLHILNVAALTLQAGSHSVADRWAPASGFFFFFFVYSSDTHTCIYVYILAYCLAY